MKKSLRILIFAAIMLSQGSVVHGAVAADESPIVLEGLTGWVMDLARPEPESNFRQDNPIALASTASITVDRQTLRVTGQAYRKLKLAMQHADGQYVDTIVENWISIDGNTVPDFFEMEEIDGARLMSGKFTQTLKMSPPLDGPVPNFFASREGTFSGFVYKNQDRQVTEAFDFGRHFVIIHDDNGGIWLIDSQGNIIQQRRDFDGESFIIAPIAAVRGDWTTQKKSLWLVDARDCRYGDAHPAGRPFGEDEQGDIILRATGRNTTVRGAATDGATMLWMVTEAPGPGKVTFTLPRVDADGFVGPPTGFEQAKGVRISVPTVELDKHYAMALYRSPMTFGNEFAQSRSIMRDVALDIDFEPELASANAQTNVREGVIQLVRPPVVLQHGTYDNPDYCWRKFPQDDLVVADYPPDHNAMFNVLRDEGFVLPDGSPAVFTVDYENNFVNVSEHGKYTSSGLDKFERPVQVAGQTVGSSSFVNLAHVLWENPGGISEALSAYRKSGFAATQADVICHSLGGLVARLYIRGAHLFNRGPQQPDEFPAQGVPPDQTVWYYRPDNFMRGDVHRLITISTTHKGSDAPGMLLPIDEILDDPWDTRQSNVRQRIQLDIFEHKLSEILLKAVKSQTGTGGAFRDQLPNSPALQRIGATPVPAHAIACTCTDSEVENTFKGFYNDRVMMVYLACNSPSLARFWREQEYGVEYMKRLVYLRRDTIKWYSGYAGIKLVATGLKEYWEAEHDEMHLVLGRTMQAFKSNPVLKVSLREFRAMTFGYTENDSTVRLESSLGGLGQAHSTMIPNTLHGYAPTYPAVQARVVALLRGGLQDFDRQGFPPAGGITKNNPPGSPPVFDTSRPAPTPGYSGNIKSSSLPPKHWWHDRLLREGGELTRDMPLRPHSSIGVEGGPLQLSIRSETDEGPSFDLALHGDHAATVVHFGEDGNPDRVDLSLNEGRISIDKQPGSPGRILLETQALTVESLSTRYTVTHDRPERQTLVAVNEGQVKITPKNGSSPFDLSAPETLTVKAGMRNFESPEASVDYRTVASPPDTATIVPPRDDPAEAGVSRQAAEAEPTVVTLGRPMDAPAPSTETFPLWLDIDSATTVVTIASGQGKLIAVTSGGGMWLREPVLQPSQWTGVGGAQGIVLLAYTPQGLLGLTSQGGLWRRRSLSEFGLMWDGVANLAGVVAMTSLKGQVYAVTTAARLVVTPGTGNFINWNDLGPAQGVVALAAAGDQLMAAANNGRLYTRKAAQLNAPWRDIGPVTGVVSMTVVGDHLFAVTKTQRLIVRTLPQRK